MNNEHNSKKEIRKMKESQKKAWIRTHNILADVLARVSGVPEELRLAAKIAMAEGQRELFLLDSDTKREIDDALDLESLMETKYAVYPKGAGPNEKPISVPFDSMTEGCIYNEVCGIDGEVHPWPRGKV